MKHEVKIGSRFKLGPWEWKVTDVGEPGDFYASRIATDRPEATMALSGEFFGAKDASCLDWIKPKVAFTKEQRQELRFWGQHLRTENQQVFYSWLDTHTEKEV